MTDWLHDEHGNVRRELHVQSVTEIDERAAEIDARYASGQKAIWLQQVFVDPAKWAISAGTDGWLTVVRVNLFAQHPPFLVTGPHGGGFIGLDMIGRWRTVEAGGTP